MYFICFTYFKNIPKENLHNYKTENKNHTCQNPCIPELDG